MTAPSCGSQHHNPRVQSLCGYRAALIHPILDRMTMATPSGTCMLADGHQMPVLGLGVWQIPDGRECIDAVRMALEAGYGCPSIGEPMRRAYELNRNRSIRAQLTEG